MQTPSTRFSIETEAAKAAASNPRPSASMGKRRRPSPSSLRRQLRTGHKLSTPQSMQEHSQAKLGVAQRPNNINNTDSTGSSDLEMTGLGSQFQLYSVDQGLACEDLAKLHGRSTAFDHHYVVDEPNALDVFDFARSGWNLSESQGPASLSVPYLSEGSSSHSGSRSKFSSASATTSYVSTEYSSESMDAISYDFSVVDSIIAPSIEPLWWPSLEDCAIPEYDLFHELGDPLNDSSNAPICGPTAPTLDHIAWSENDHFPPACVVQVVSVSDTKPPADHQLFDDGEVHATLSHSEECQGIDLVAPNRTDCHSTKFQSARLTPVQSTVQPKGGIASCSRATPSTSVEDVTSAPSDVDSHSDYEWSTETTTSVGDELLRSYRSVQQQNPKVYLQHLGALLNVALVRFGTWVRKGQRSRPYGANQQQAQPLPNTTVSTESASQYPPKKRGRETRKKSGATNEEDEEDDEEDIRRAKKAKPESPDDDGLMFACPFFRLNPSKHADCLSHTLRRIRDVKQHLVRRHLRPPFCPICGNIYNTQAEQEAHVEDQTCERTPYFSKPNGITQDQRAQLSHKSCRNLSPKEQWFRVWDIVFPEIDRPDSAYMSEPFTEVTGECERFWEDKGEVVFAEWLAASGLSYGSPETNTLLSALFLDCSRRLFQLFRRQLARSTSFSPPDMTESSSNRQGEASPETFLSQYNVTMATGDAMPPSLLANASGEINVQGQMVDVAIINAGMTNSFESQELVQSTSIPDLVSTLQGTYDFDDSFFTDDLDPENNAEHDAIMMAIVKTRLDQESKGKIGSEGNLSPYLCGQTGDS